MLSNSRRMEWSIQAYEREPSGFIDLFVYAIHEINECAQFHVVV